MRAQPFLQVLSCFYNTSVAEEVSQLSDFRGGWETWLQVEIARTFIKKYNAQLCIRELPYPSATKGKYLNSNGQTVTDVRSAARTDFFMQRPSGFSTDDTYIELKCTNNASDYPVSDAWTRFQSDIGKISTMQKANSSLNCIATLAYHGTLPLTFNEEGEPTTLGGKSIDWYGESSSRSTYIWYTDRKFSFSNDKSVLSLNTALGEIDSETMQDNTLLMLACAAL